jgi:hypothetical protein
MRHRRLAIALVLALVGLALTLAACGGDDEETTTTTPAPAVEAPSGGTAPPNAPGSGDPVIECMAEQGFEVESPADLNTPEEQQALQACLGPLHGG